MKEFDKQLAVNTFLHWLDRRYHDQTEKLALQYERDIQELGSETAEDVLKERVSRMMQSNQQPKSL
jgi:hypothetical protein